MTIAQQIALTNKTIPNTYPSEIKIAWLSTLDHMIYNELIKAHEGEESIVYNGYDESTSEDTELLAKEPYSEIYGYWLEAKIHYYNGESERYANAITMFNSVYSEFAKRYVKEHRPTIRRRWSFF